jgi:tetratricopeptide (TPR) repeat protein
MEVLARDRQLPLGGSRYEEGARQFESNLDAIARVLKASGARVFIGSLASNLRDQPPFASAANAAPGSADSVFEDGRIALARGDSALAGRLFTHARDLDVVRFRAPSEFNRIIRTVTGRTGAVYVPVAEAFAAASPGGLPGANLFLEHVHPTRVGQALIGRAFFESLLRAGALGITIDTTRLRQWDAYTRGMDLTPFDERIAFHITRTLTTRWPFVPVAQQLDYRGQYIPTNLLDSLAFAVSRGARWEIAKVQLATDYERDRQFDSSAAEYAGLARDAPLQDEPLLLMARSLGEAGHLDEAEAALRRAVAIRPSAPALTVLGTRAAQRRDIPQAISFFRQSLAIQPAQPTVLYQLALAYGVSRDLPNARDAALQLARIAPDYPRLPGLMAALGLRQ